MDYGVRGTKALCNNKQKGREQKTSGTEGWKTTAEADIYSSVDTRRQSELNLKFGYVSDVTNTAQ